MAWTLEIHHIDVGQGESTLVIARERDHGGNVLRERTALIDGGRALHAWRVHDYIRRRVTRRLDRILTTHYDIDHSGGLTTLMTADNRSAQTGLLARSGADAAINEAINHGGGRRQCACVAAAAIAATAMGAYGVGLPERAAAITYARGQYNNPVSIETAARRGYEWGREYIEDSMADLPDSILPTQAGTRLRKTAVRGGVAAGTRAGRNVLLPGWREGVLRDTTQAVDAALETLTDENSRFDTGELYTAADVLDRGDDMGGEDFPAYRRAALGYVREAAGDHLSFLIPSVGRARITPVMGSEVLWNIGLLAQPAPAGAPTIWMVAANEYVRNNVNPVHGHVLSNSRGLGFIIRFNNFFYYTGGDLETVSEDLIANDILAHALPNPQGGNFAVPQHICAFKCGHHGSRTSTSDHFVNAIHARAAFISTGGTQFEHPDQDVIDRLHLSNDIRLFYLTNCNFQTNHVPASQGQNQLLAPLNKSRVAGDNQTELKVNRGDIVLHVNEAESLAGPNHGFRVTYWDDDAPRPGGWGTGGIMTEAHNH